jgi:hypothetical protein
MGAEGSVTLQLREAVQAPESNGSLDGALTIGYPDHDMLADMLGTLQAAGKTHTTVESSNKRRCLISISIFPSGAGADSPTLDSLDHIKPEKGYTKVTMSPQPTDSGKPASTFTPSTRQIVKN